MKRAEAASQQYRKAADAKVVAKNDIRALHKERKEIKSKLSRHEAKATSIQQYRHDANRAEARAQELVKESRKERMR